MQLRAGTWGPLLSRHGSIQAQLTFAKVAEAEQSFSSLLK